MSLNDFLIGFFSLVFLIILIVVFVMIIQDRAKTNLLNDMYQKRDISNDTKEKYLKKHNII